MKSIIFVGRSLLASELLMTVFKFKINNDYLL